MSNDIYLDAPNVGKHEKAYLGKAIDAGYISTVGPFVPEFEERFARYLSVKKAVSTQSGTAAIHTALHELGIGKGDEVIVPTLTFVATITPVLYVGAKPVFVDVDEKTWNVAPEEIERHITKKTRAIIPVHLYGNPCDMNAIVSLARKHKLYVIEDATESLGARYEGLHTGTLGDLGCFSFNGNKVITTGGGGMVVGNSRKQMEHIKFLVNQAREKAQSYYHSEVGFNYRMTNVEAALGLAQLERLQDFLKKKKDFYAIYRKELEGFPFVRFQEELTGAESSRWLTCATFERGIDLVALQQKLDKDGVPTRRVFMPVTEFPNYKAYPKGLLKNSYHIYDRGLCLPASTRNSKDDIYAACKSIKKHLERLSA